MCMVDGCLVRTWSRAPVFWLASVAGRDVAIIAHRFVLYPVSSC